MERRLAQRIIGECVAFDVPFTALDAFSNEIADPTEKKAFRLALGNLMAQVYVDLMVPILRQYPDLNPDKDKIGPGNPFSKD